jgi:hypothetical protein
MQSVEAASAAPSSTSKNCTKHDGMHHASDSEKPWSKVRMSDAKAWQFSKT